MTFIDICFAAMLATPLIRRLAPVPIHDAAPNPAGVAARVFEPNFGEMEKQMNDFAPKRPAATLETMMIEIEDTDADLREAIDTVERLIEHKRTQVATLRARLDLEDADIAARTEQVVKMRAALRAEPAEPEDKP